MRHQRRDCLNHFVARHLVVPQRPAERIRDFPIHLARQKLAEEEQIFRHRLGLNLNHRAMRLRHADDGQRAVEHPLRDRLAAVPRDIEKALEAGFFRYLTKPIKVNQFMEALDAALIVATTDPEPAAEEKAV